jgi:uroporphyrinogen-III synthase
VDVVPAYRNVIPAEARARAAKIFAGGKKPHWVTFTSSSTVRNFLDVAGAAALDGVRAASIGPVTSATLRENGIAVAAEACEFTSDGLIAAVIAAG